MRDAIDGNLLQVHLQPIWHLGSDRLAGAESLARWTSRSHGAVAAGAFVPFAERSGLIRALTRWSINASLRLVAAMPGMENTGFATNLSPRVSTDPALVEQILGALDIWGVPPSCLIAEITGTALVNDLELSVRIMHRLRDVGGRIAIDDFGTGYASFLYLRRFPATELKIDMSLVIGMCQDQRTGRLVQAMINMARHLDLVAAEGTEDQATRDRLADMGCDFGQRYHLDHNRRRTSSSLWKHLLSLRRQFGISAS